MARTKLWAILLVFLCTLFSSSAQLFYKSGADKLKFDLMSILTNWNILIGMILYVIGAVLLIIALKGGQVTVLYPIIASSYIWVAIGSSYFFGEIINLTRWIGLSFVVLGILMITFSEKNGDGVEYIEAV